MNSHRVALAPILTVSVALGGCATEPIITYESDSPAMVLSTAGAAGISDGRARFREIFCERFRAIGPPENGKPSCGDYLHRLVDGVGPPVVLLAPWDVKGAELAGGDADVGGSACIRWIPPS